MCNTRAIATLNKILLKIYQCSFRFNPCVVFPTFQHKFVNFFFQVFSRNILVFTGVERLHISYNYSKQDKYNLYFYHKKELFPDELIVSLLLLDRTYAS